MSKEKYRKVRNSIKSDFGSEGWEFESSRAYFS